MAIERCACGRPLHYANATDRFLTERMIEVAGPQVPVRLGGRTWLVQQHYLALHGPTNLHKMKFPEIVSDGYLLPYIFDEGSALLSATIDYANQVFTHVDLDHTERHFHIPKLQQLADQRIKGVELMEFGMTEEQVEFVIANRGIEDDHINQRMTDKLLDQPGLICAWEDQSQLVVDGNHRYVARFRRGKPFMQFFVFPEQVWRRSLLNWPVALFGR